jgi:hypothetical protein
VAIRESGLMTKVQTVGFGEGARESVSRQYIHDDVDMDMPSSD